jgi:hypothetical protein
VLQREGRQPLSTYFLSPARIAYGLKYITGWRGVRGEVKSFLTQILRANDISPGKK